MSTAFGGGGNQRFAGAFRAEDVKLNWNSGGASGSSGGAGSGALVQQAQWSCQRTVNMIYEIGSNNVYYVGNRRQGTAQFTRVVSGRADFKNLIRDFGNLCTPRDLTLNAQLQPGCVPPAGSGTTPPTAGGVRYILKAGTLTQVGASTSAQEIVINEQIGFMFVDLDYS